MRLSRRAAVLAALPLVLAPLPALAAASPTAAVTTASNAAALTTSWAPVPVAERLQPALAEQLAAGGSDPLRVMVSGTSTQAAREAVAAVGLQAQDTWDAVGVVVAIGPPDAVRSVVVQPGVTYVEADEQLEYSLDTAHAATRSDEALATYATADGARIDGAGVTIAVIDSGIDSTHPMFQRDGETTVVRNLRNVCDRLTLESETCFRDDPVGDTDVTGAGGHGTHVAGIAGGVEVTTTGSSPKNLRGAAPGANLVGFGLGQVLFIVNANAAMNWVVEHQAQPCKPKDQQDGPADPACPPIRVTNHSYGPGTVPEGGHRFDENSATVRLQRALVDKGVVPVWAAGNSSGDGTVATTNPPAMDPTGGVLMVGSYNDENKGNRNGSMSSFSSRGKKGDPTTYPDLSAPGDRITSACRPYLPICSTGLAPLNGPGATDVATFNTISGTSMAAPYVAGVVAQMFQADPSLTPAEAELILEDTAHEFAATAGSDGEYEPDPRNPNSETSFDKGHGLVDVLAALGTVQGVPVADEEPLAPPAPRCGDGTALVTDPAGDTHAPGGTGAPAAAQDITQIDFAADDAAMTVTQTYVNLSQIPAPGSTSTNHFVAWTGPDGTDYAVFHSTPGGGFSVGEFNAAGVRLVAGTSTPVEGAFSSGPGGTISWTVPLELVGSPTIPVDQTTDPDAQPAVSNSYGLAIAGVGALGSGLRYTAPVDRAPDGGATPAWSVCNSEPAEEPVEEEPGDGGEGGAPECEPKGNSGGKGNGKGSCNSEKDDEESDDA
jgi:serine protease AprX